MYVGGEIADLARMARPRIGVVTAVQPVHLSRIGSLEAIEAAKGELLEALPPDGRRVLNADDPIVRRMGVAVGGAQPHLRLRGRRRRRRRGRRVGRAGRDALHAARRSGAAVRSSIPTLGRLSVHNALAAAAVGLAAGLSLDEIATGLAGGWSAPHRVQLVRLGGGHHHRRHLQRLAAVGRRGARPARRPARPARRGPRRDARAGRGGRGRPSRRRRGRGAHGRLAGRRRSRRGRHRRGRAGRGAGPGRGSSASATSSRPLEAIPPRLRDGDVVLVKASRGIGLDRLVDALRAKRPDAAARPVSVELIQGLLLAFALMVILMSPYIRLLHALGFGKRIRRTARRATTSRKARRRWAACSSCVVVIGIYFFLRRGPDAATFAPLAALAGVGLLGAFDDYLNARTGEGIRARQKLIWLTVVAVVAACQIQQTYDITAIAVPFVGPVTIDPWVYVVFAAFAIVAAANGVNITDGLDGLSGGTVVIAFVAYMLIALLNEPLAQPNLALLCALIIGALLGFLWFNVHPAQIFIGDSGALSLGATLAVTALITGQILVLPLIGIIFVIETMSVILQVGYFKLTGGKRIFRMSPIHHHFELGGWDEEKITIRFWIVGDPRRAPRRDPLPRLAGPAPVTAMTTPRPGRPRRPHHGRDPRRRPAGPAGDRPRPRPQRDRPGALPRRRRRPRDDLRRPAGRRARRRRSRRSATGP